MARWGQQRGRQVFLLALLWTSPLLALPERPMSVGVNAGLPDLMGIAADVVALPPRIQIGVGVGLDVGFGGGLLPINKLVQNISNPRQVVFTDGRTYELTPQAEPVNLNMITPFIRYYPTKGNFYLQLTYALLRISTRFGSTIHDVKNGVDINGLVTGDVAFVQQIPTISIGNVFMSKAFFINVRLGASFLFTTTCHVTLTANLPDAVGGVDANKSVLSSVEQQVSDAVVKSTDDAKKQVFLIPSLAITMGVIL